MMMYCHQFVCVVLLLTTIVCRDISFQDIQSPVGILLYSVAMANAEQHALGSSAGIDKYIGAGAYPYRDYGAGKGMSRHSKGDDDDGEDILMIGVAKHSRFFSS